MCFCLIFNECQIMKFKIVNFVKTLKVIKSLSEIWYLRRCENFIIWERYDMPDAINIYILSVMINDKCKKNVNQNLIVSVFFHVDYSCCLKNKNKQSFNLKSLCNFHQYMIYIFWLKFGLANAIKYYFVFWICVIALQNIL